MESFSQFIATYDVPGAVILLEGKRKVLTGDESALVAIGEKLCREMRHARFRSGNASGSDELFSMGVARINPYRLEVIVPYTGHRKKNSLGYHTHSMDEISLAAEPEVTYHTKSNSSKAKLVDDYAGGIMNGVTIKAAYLLRDTVKVIGTRSGIPKATVALFYDDLENPCQGGTGHTMTVCKNNKVPYFIQSTWMKWL
jgi:hypothetical protein